MSSYNPYLEKFNIPSTGDYSSTTSSVNKAETTSLAVKSDKYGAKVDDEVGLSSIKMHQTRSLSPYLSCK